jgi:alpha-beta hydrolase superfamily lysophospholipase
MVREKTPSRFAGARAACLGLLALAASACAPVVAPRGLENDTPEITADSFITRDGLHLPLREWDAKTPKAVLIALHGMSDYSEAYDLPGPWWAEHGITTIAYDQRGFGHAPNPGIWAGGDVMLTDLDDCVDAARTKFPGVPVFAIGESMGGAELLAALASDRPPRVDGVILSAPAVFAREDMPLSYRVTLWVGAHTIPWKHLSGSGLHLVPSDNIAELRKLGRDPYFQHDSRVDQIYGLVDMMDAARKAPAKLSNPPPILVLHGEKDQLIPLDSTRATLAALGNHADQRDYPNGYHMLMRDLDRELVWKDVDDWVTQHATAASSHN